MSYRWTNRESVLPTEEFRVPSTPTNRTQATHNLLYDPGKNGTYYRKVKMASYAVASLVKRKQGG